MERINQLEKKLNHKTFIISDPTAIYYLTGYKADPGNRMMVLVFSKDKEPTLFINQLFPKPNTLNVVAFKDGDNAAKLLSDFVPNGDIYIEGSLPSKFLIPLLNKDRTFIDGSYIIETMRSIKDAKEIEKLQIASSHNDRIMQEMTEHFKEGITEIELSNIIKEKQSTLPLSGISFEPISVFSENIADPHGIPSNRKLKKGDVILIDMGGTYENYRSDMTRAFFFGRNEKLEAIYDVVLQANMAAIDAIEIGKPLSRVDKAARDIITEAGYGAHFIHRTGHGIGLDTHETLDVSSANDTLIKEGMCFSIEPGIYIEGVGGIRIEDLVCVSKDKTIVLNQFPKHKIYVK